MEQHMTDKHFGIFVQAQKRPTIDHQQSTKALWTDPHIAKQMLKSHLDPTNDAASYRRDTIDAAVGWMSSHFHLSRGDSYLDLGCGPGNYTLRMAEKGLRVTGVDFSENSIQYAKNEAMGRDLTIQAVP
jgi:2-polyprenyl-3-methyl-5-hydroxy-6-metoxy-1,4-benzoquinol methylase